MSLQATNLSVQLGGRLVLDGVTAEFASGRITGLIGPNGAGKTTLIRSLAGLVALQSGEARIDGTSVARLEARARGRAIAYLPQDRLVHWPLAARTVVALGRLPHRGRHAGESGADTAAIDAAMAAMDVTALRDRPVAALSGGELARVLFARALAQEAPIILADEPSAGLDPAHALGLFDVLRRLAAEGRSIVVALHDLSFAARYCDDVVMLAGGRVVASGSAADVLLAERLAPVFGARIAVGRIDGVPIVVPVSPLAR